MELDTHHQKIMGITIEFTEGFPLIIDLPERIRCEAASELIHPDDLPRFTDMLSYREDGDRLEAHCRIAVKGGYHRFFISCRPITEQNGRLVRFDGYMLDANEFSGSSGKNESVLPDIRRGDSLEDIFGREYLLSLQRPFSSQEVFSGIYAPDGRLICSAKGTGGKKRQEDYPYIKSKSIRVNHIDCGSWVLGAKSEDLLNESTPFWETLVLTLSRMANAFAALLAEMENSQDANKLLSQNMEEQILLNNIYAIIMESSSGMKALEGVTELVGDYFKLDRICIAGLAGSDCTDRVWYRSGAYHRGVAERKKRSLEYFTEIATELKKYGASFSAGKDNELSEYGVKAYALFYLFTDGDNDSIISYEMLENEHTWSQRERKQLRSISQIISSLLMRISAQEKLEESQRRLSQLAFYDSIFNIPNRAKLSRDLTELINGGKSGALIAFKISDTRSISAVYGHTYSDMLLRNVAEYLSKLPIKDIGVYYFSNAIFMIDLPGCGSDGAKSLVRTLIYRFCEPWTFRGVQHNIRCSMGIAFYPLNGKTPDEVCKAASVAMYRAREFGKNSYTFYSGTLESSRTAAGSMERRITESVANGMEGFSLKYQPIFDTVTGELVCCESLVRFNDPLYGNIPNSTLFPLAESLGLSAQIDGWVTEKACAFCKRAQENGFPSLKVSVDLMTEELRSGVVVGNTERALAQSGLNPSSLVLEIPVKANLPYNDSTGILTDLKRLGVNIAIDSYGAESISLKMLKNPYVDIISMPYQVLRGSKEEFDRILIEAVVSLAHCNSLKICIKGIESSEQLSEAIMLGADRVQGFFCSKPLDSGDFKPDMLRCPVVNT